MRIDRILVGLLLVSGCGGADTPDSKTAAAFHTSAIPPAAMRSVAS
jgi:hypothetical protein